MAGTRRKRTAEEQGIFDEIEALKRLRTEQVAEVDRAVDLLFETPPAEAANDAVIGVRARAALAARHRLDETGQKIARLHARYDALRARATGDVPF